MPRDAPTLAYCAGRRAELFVLFDAIDKSWRQGPGAIRLRDMPAALELARRLVPMAARCLP